MSFKDHQPFLLENSSLHATLIYGESWQKTPLVFYGVILVAILANDEYVIAGAEGEAEAWHLEALGPWLSAFPSAREGRRSVPRPPSLCTAAVMHLRLRARPRAGAAGARVAADVGVWAGDWGAADRASVVAAGAMIR